MVRTQSTRRGISNNLAWHKASEERVTKDEQRPLELCQGLGRFRLFRVFGLRCLRALRAGRSSRFRDCGLRGF